MYKNKSLDDVFGYLCTNSCILLDLYGLICPIVCTDILAFECKWKRIAVIEESKTSRWRLRIFSMGPLGNQNMPIWVRGYSQIGQLTRGLILQLPKAASNGDWDYCANTAYFSPFPSCFVSPQAPCVHTYNHSVIELKRVNLWFPLEIWHLFLSLKTLWNALRALVWTGDRKKYANLLKLRLSADVSLFSAGTHNVAVVMIAVIYIEYVQGLH